MNRKQRERAFAEAVNRAHILRCNCGSLVHRPEDKQAQPMYSDGVDPGCKFLRETIINKAISTYWNL